MTITRILYLLVSHNVLWRITKANQPVGYLGCFQDLNGDSLVEPRTRLDIDLKNKGESCKSRCKDIRKRYAGTKGYWCLCGSGVFQNKTSDSKQCNLPCPGNSFTSEICGGSWNGGFWNRISLYDTRQTVATSTSTIFTSFSTQAIWSSTTAPQTSENKLAIYIAVPVSIVVLIVFVLVVTVLFLRKKLSQKKDNQKAVYENSTNTSRSLIVVANNAYNDHDIIPSETSVNVHATEDTATGDTEHSYYILEQTGDVNRSCNNFDQRSGSAIQNDDNGYGHLHVRSTALPDPTYSHTTLTSSQNTTDHTYSHMHQSVGKQNQEIMSNVDQDTYNTCNIMGGEGKLRPAVEINDVDDTYNRLAISGKAEKIGEKQTVSSVNEPDYDHTDVKKH